METCLSLGVLSLRDSFSSSNVVQTSTLKGIALEVESMHAKNKILETPSLKAPMHGLIAPRDF